MQVDGNTIPAAMAGRARRYLFQVAPTVALNGRGEAVTAGYPSLIWEWGWLLDSDMDFWFTTVLGGASHKLCGGTTQLYDHRKVLRTYTSCNVYIPTYRTIENGVYLDVTLTIRDLKA